MADQDTHHFESSYTCLLIPRFPSHQIQGDLADSLSQWLQQICIASHWKIEFTTIHPDYFQWGLWVNALTTPNHITQTIRTETSKLILSNFSFMDQDKLSDDFWAPGYLAILGIHPHLDEILARYISLIRRQPG